MTGDEAQHTPEPWLVGPGYSGGYRPHDILICGDRQPTYAADDDDDDAETGEMTGYSAVTAAAALGNATSGGIPAANARRIVACINACAGIATRDLETAAANPGGDHCRLSWLAQHADRLAREIEAATEPEQRVKGAKA